MNPTLDCPVYPWNYLSIIRHRIKFIVLYRNIKFSDNWLSRIEQKLVKASSRYFRANVRKVNTINVPPQVSPSFWECTSPNNIFCQQKIRISIRRVSGSSLNILVLNSQDCWYRLVLLIHLLASFAMPTIKASPKTRTGSMFTMKTQNQVWLQKVKSSDLLQSDHVFNTS